MDEVRRQAQELAREYVERGDAVGWFEPLYERAAGDAGRIQWADLEPNPQLVAWLDREAGRGEGRRALVIGCGLGDDAEELARRGFTVTAFDIAPTAIDWCRHRFPNSQVEYTVADVLNPPPDWRAAFDFVLESYTLQVLPPPERRAAIVQIAQLLAPGGRLVVIARGREPSDAPGRMPWPLTRDELSHFEAFRLREVRFEDYGDTEQPPVRRFRVEYRARQPDGA